MGTATDDQRAGGSASPPRWQYLLLLLCVLAAGYASRRYAHLLPGLLRKRTGDALWASAVFVLLAVARPDWATWKRAGLAIGIAWCVEFSQRYHAAWID